MAHGAHDGTRAEPHGAEDEVRADLDQQGEELSRLARLLESEDDTGLMLDELVAAAVRLIPGAQEGSISVVTAHRRITPEHPSGALPERVDAIQTETGQGPCLDAVYQQQTVRVPDMRHEERWPDFARRAAEAGAASMLSFQLYVEGDTLGALNLYARQPGGFDEESEQVGLLFASHASVAFASARKLDHLARAVDSRDLIGQAKGILMERFGLGAEQAFTVLVRTSSTTGRKLRDVASELVDTRRLAAPSPRTAGTHV